MNEVVEMAGTGEAVARLPAVQQQGALVASPDRLLEIAVERGMGLDYIERLMGLKERNDANLARDAYNAAMANFKKMPLEIFKDKHVFYTSQKGDTSYDHATLGNICDVIVKALAEHDITHRWDTKQAGGKITVTCILRHKAGHEERTTLEVEAEGSGGKNAVQAIGSAVTYLSRYTLLSATGTATKALPDDDGRAAGAGGTDISALLVGLGAMKTSETALAYWKAHRDELAGDKKAGEAFKAAVIEYRTQLAGA